MQRFLDLLHIRVSVCRITVAVWQFKLPQIEPLDIEFLRVKLFVGLSGEQCAFAVLVQTRTYYDVTHRTVVKPLFYFALKYKIIMPSVPITIFGSQAATIGSSLPESPSAPELDCST